MTRRLAALLRRTTTRNDQPSGQCSVCGGTFPGWNGGICAACIATGRS